MRSHELGWRGDPADIVVSNEPDARAAAFRDWLLERVPDWHRDALCREYDASLWFPTRGRPTSQAIEICRRCGVREECLAEAIEDPALDHGVRGGVPARSRAAMRRELRGAA